MRIISGKLGGRQFGSPRGHRTHPMGDKIRGALFNILGDIEGFTVLDAFSGSGALAFEAISRGASSAVALDNDKSAQTAIAGNIKELGLHNKVKLIRANASGWSDNNNYKHYDLVLLDPPYDNIQEDLILKLVGHCKSGGTVVLSLPPKNELVLPDDKYTALTAKNYGDSKLVFYRKN